MKDFAELREEYLKASFSEHDASDDAIEQFEVWYTAAVKEDLPLPNACALATMCADGGPSVRMVLLKGYEGGRFSFFTNYESQKGSELSRHPQASLLFWWPPLERQIRIRGRCERASGAESDAYFATRPRLSNLSALASKQSQVVVNRQALEADVEALSAEWDGRELERPDHMGCFSLDADELEFWQGRADRLHDRLRYRRDGDGWVRERLYP